MGNFGGNQVSSQKNMAMNDLSMLIEGYDRMDKNNQKIDKIKESNCKLSIKLIINKMRKLILLPYTIYLVLCFIGILPKVYNFIYIIIFGVLGSVPIISQIMTMVWYLINISIIFITVLLPISYYKVGQAIKNSKKSMFIKIPCYKKIIDNESNNPEIIKNKSKIQRIEDDNNEIRNIMMKSGVYDRIPSDYANFYAVSNLFIYLHNHRADTLKEAINLFETEEHQQRMEHQQERILESSERAEINSRIAAMNAYSAMRSSERAADHAQRAEIAANKPVTVHVNVEKF